MAVRNYDAGGYRYSEGVFQYSGGVAAEPGHEIVRVRFCHPVPLADGFRRIEAIIDAAHRPITSFCACELRSPAPFSEAGFSTFNRSYVETLERWKIFDGTTNPVARSNVCPAIDPPNQPSFYAFSYTLKSDSAAPSFVVSGGAEAPEGRATYRDHAIRPGDVSAAGIREKAIYVLDEMERRLAALGCSWRDTTATQLYTVHDVHPAYEDEIAKRGAARSGLTWFLARPPIAGLEFEMDCRGVNHEYVV